MLIHIFRSGYWFRLLYYLYEKCADVGVLAAGTVWVSVPGVPGTDIDGGVFYVFLCISNVF